jgi:hypothetical protein
MVDFWDAKVKVTLLAVSLSSFSLGNHSKLVQAVRKLDTAWRYADIKVWSCYLLTNVCRMLSICARMRQWTLCDTRNYNYSTYCAIPDLCDWLDDISRSL